MDKVKMNRMKQKKLHNQREIENREQINDRQRQKVRTIETERERGSSEADRAHGSQ